MASVLSARCAAILLLSAGGLALAQSTPPATEPTSLPAPPPTAATAVSQPVRHRPVVIYSRSHLTVLADNSSLNQILRDISRQTGMTITGGVTEERVYGKYGPSSPTHVLSELLEGTGTNMILRDSESGAPAELTLSPGDGGAMPPGPSLVAADPETPPPGQTAPSANRVLTPEQVYEELLKLQQLNKNQQAANPQKVTF